ncbi:Xaa-Pro peptidase family protein [Desulfovibrio mangrovi]|uniref:M24 family metallopeptidase n=1 Tax=Desulfovibrio mangrovi TaxID=2976983 RepID=UPI0022457C6E|nr:Xaa-Pro peptidase family protein [Desulfovibrio mangrovi]UZP67461.1 Xaa-Pro peptidase family protein [Desulfovibrio mangrovi]
MTRHTAIEVIPSKELEKRHARCRALLETHAPQASGMLVFARVNIYHLTGTLGNGLFWLPKEGAPVLLVRHGIERCRLESPLEHIHSFRSYGDIAKVLHEVDSPLGDTVAVEYSGLTWQLGELLRAKLADKTFVSCDTILTLARSVKTPWELAKLRLAGQRHHESLHRELPRLIRPGMNEREISHRAWDVFFARGHSGILRMNAFGEEIFLGHVSAGENGNYPNHFNGPLGVKGEHPATPYMGYSGTVWKKGSPLAVDIGFCLEGYHTDKTQLYWSGKADSIPDSVRRAHDTSIAIQHHVAERMRPGAIPSEIYREAVQMADKAGFAEGFMALGKGKVPFVGHGIGLGIDEFPVLANKFDAPMEAGMVMAVEPKIGIEGIGMVGVENTFEITENGAACITGDEYDMVCVE